MGDPMDVSLDDLIRNSSSQNRAGRGGRGGRGNRFFTNNHRSASLGGMRSDAMEVDFQVTDNLSPTTRRRNTNQRRAEPYRRPPKGNVEGVWAHDLFDAPKQRSQATVTVTNAGGGPVIVRIANLHYNVGYFPLHNTKGSLLTPLTQVSEQDIWELMGSVST